jgi:hypothetical protein
MTPLAALHPKLDFVDRGGLYVAYRASAEPQLLEIRVEAAGPDTIGMGTSLLRGLLSVAASGATSGVDFAPTAGRATLLSGPRTPDDPGGRGPVFEWELEVAAMSPLYLRHMVEDLALAGWPEHPVLSVGIRGELAPDDSPLSARTADVRRWLRDAEAYPGFAGPPPFPLVELDYADAKDALVRVRPAGIHARTVLDRFDTTLLRWASYLVGLPSREAGPIGSSGTMRSAASKRELVARFEDFDVFRAPARDALLAVLTRFHAEVAPLDRVEIGLP